MTLGMLLLGMFWVIWPAVVSYELGIRYGTVGYFAGVFLGAGVSYVLTWALFSARLRLLFPLPFCRQGKCRGYDQYHWPIGTPVGWIWSNVYRYRCNCESGEYVRCGKRFMIALPNGEFQPFKRLTSFRQWEDDKSSAE